MPFGTRSNPRNTPPAAPPQPIPHPQAAIPPRPADPDEAVSRRLTEWQADPVLHPELVSHLELALQAPGYFASDAGVSLTFLVRGGPQTHEASDRGRLDLFWWELDTFAAGLAALVEQARRDGTIPTRPSGRATITRADQEALETEGPPDAL